jgi:hypothetical protein
MSETPTPSPDFDAFYEIKVRARLLQEEDRKLFERIKKARQRLKEAQRPKAPSPPPDQSEQDGAE